MLESAEERGSSQSEIRSKRIDCPITRALGREINVSTDPFVQPNLASRVLEVQMDDEHFAREDDLQTTEIKAYKEATSR